VSKVFNSVFREDVEDTYLGCDHGDRWWGDGEFATRREFAFKDQGGTYRIREMLCIWNEDVLRALPTVVMYGQLLVGDALLLVKMRDWPQRPRRGQVVWTPRDTPWTILKCQEIMRTVYRMSLEAVEAQA
jgi:hypothetical protein